MKSRDELPALLTELDLTGDGIEIGAGAGRYSDQILSGSKLRRLFSVDPWSKTEANEDWLSEPELYLEAVRLLSKHGPRSVVLRMFSVEAAALFGDESLDFVHIDGWHHGGIRDDIAAWWPKMKPGGIFSGHDYSPKFPTVQKAVDDFVAAFNLALCLTDCDFIAPDGYKIQTWIVRKP